ncbi:MAG TPA: hypothetical protein DCO77_12755 [Nitrospiraceae bacterium]|nr:hypothetical protein [Nitrospiraceae bacterium]
MTTRRTRQLTALMSLFLLLSCGGGGGGDGGGGDTDTLSFAVAGGASGSYTETGSVSAPDGYDPDLTAYYDASGSNKTYIKVFKDYNGFTWDEMFTVDINGNAAGTVYAIDSSTTLSYQPASGNDLYALSGSITVITYGAVSGRITGNFDVMVCDTPVPT